MIKPFGVIETKINEIREFINKYKKHEKDRELTPMGAKAYGIYGKFETSNNRIEYDLYEKSKRVIWTDEKGCMNVYKSSWDGRIVIPTADEVK